MGAELSWEDARTHTGLSETGRTGEWACASEVGKKGVLSPTDMLLWAKESGLKYLKRGLENQVFTPVTHNINNENKNPVLLVDSWIVIKTWNVSV